MGFRACRERKLSRVCLLCTTWQLILCGLETSRQSRHLFCTANFEPGTDIYSSWRCCTQLGMDVLCAEQSPDAEAVAAGRSPGVCTAQSPEAGGVAEYFRGLHCAVA